MYTLLRILKFVFHNFFRNFWLTTATVSIIVITLLLVNVLLGIRFLVDASVKAVERKVELSIYFKREVPEDKILNLKTKLEQDIGVEKVEYVSRSAALEEFQQQNQGNPATLKVLDTLRENPLPASLVVKMGRVEDYARLIASLDDPSISELIAEKDYADYQALLDRMFSISNFVEKAGMGVTAVFIFLSLLIIFNAIRISIYTHREEIRIMRLVGASNRFIRWPYFIEVLLYSVIAVAVSLGMMFLLLHFIEPHLMTYFEGAVSVRSYFVKDALLIFGTQFLGLALLNMLAAALAMRTYLKV